VEVVGLSLTSLRRLLTHFGERLKAVGKFVFLWDEIAVHDSEEQRATDQTLNVKGRFPRSSDGGDVVIPEAHSKLNEIHLTT
jgi:hypothetical protein